MDRVKINRNVTYSKMIQGFWRLNDWQMTTQDLNRYLHQLVELGVTTMDHADIYGDYRCEQLFGEALALSPELRDQIELVSKCGIILPTDQFAQFDGHRYDLSKQHIVEAVNRSLQNLQTDTLDTLLIHRPSPLMDPNEVRDALDVLVEAGKIKSFGVSNFNNTQYDLLNQGIKSHKLHIAVNQLEVSPYHAAPIYDGTIDHMYRDDVKIMAWSPLAGGKLLNVEDAKSKRVMSIISPLAYKYNVAPASIVTAWLVKHPATIMPIMGTSQIERMQDAVKGLELTLTDQEWFDIYVAVLGQDIP
ncbi:aldo/keto reductase [Staphylococcus simulans]|uniref:aldo/keto reductase n=1 Tax=Staphylococcus simulans TaxID=1286 RepID=UPI000D02CAA6|nr:aldo/keto reductase [Staphylococcus simulans]PTJ03915.1 oxidoreductase [Staphylococcus simulans]PTJ18443.1 oxidoreductase [Staphylococcus simulans]PTJ47388.1 oxidoreductase [Staphylococcus simulans]PTJ87507.1 oxidoreductase [Staphylococcus simulans]